MLNRQEKEAVVASLREKFAQSQGSYLVGVQGLTVEELQKLRKQVAQKGGSLQIAKNRLVKLALFGSEDQGELSPYLKEQIAVVFFNEPIGVAKTLTDFAKDNQKLRVVVGCVESDIVNAGEIKALAAIPPREVLLGQLVAAIQSPLVGMVYVLEQMIAKAEGSNGLVDQVEQNS